ncbi:MAG: FAD-dependent oxidoreductase [Deltaproteobacteria bacterium]|nr:FAD-dependent oxidoreductase [Deltaproteobacteria bacterium]
MSDKKTGSVMVVGGGIAGMQACLDLADSGYLVHLFQVSSGGYALIAVKMPAADVKLICL